MSSGSGAGSGAGSPPSREYRFYPEDFGKIDTAPLHMDLVFDMTAERVIVHVTTTFLHSGAEPLSSLSLNAKDLEIKSVERFGSASTLGDSKAFVEHSASLADPTSLSFTVDTSDHYLNIELGEAVAPGSEFVLRTVSIARPTENILEGIYYDYTPPSKPRTMITQCQQYGFQRIAPSVDRMAAKTYFTVTIIASADYTNAITNGDLAPGYFDAATGGATPKSVSEAGIPSHIVAADDTRVVTKYYNHTVNMSPYLFFLGVGTYVTYRRHLEYPDGDTFLLELLVFPDQVKQEHAEVAINALHDSIQWTHTYSGPEAADHAEERAEIDALITEREALKAQQAPLVVATGPGAVTAEHVPDDSGAPRLAEIRARLKELIARWGKTGYKYTGQIYREIGMQNSDYGGMENVGNTTIIASMLTPSDFLADAGYVYMEGVKVHEYYHNINGSETTGQSPFEIWLNEAVTVHIQRQREDALFGHDFMRLRQVIYAFRPATGPLDQDKSPIALAILPVGFNRTQELITATTYSKAPELVSTVQRILGFDTFSKGLDHYHTKFKYSNATTADWIASMEEASGVELKALAHGWLSRPGHPTVAVTSSYDATARTYTVNMKQSGFQTEAPAGIATGPWDFAIRWALVKDGADTHTGLFRLSTEEASFSVSDVDAQPDFLSFARDWSFFGSYTKTDATDAELVAQATGDSDVVNRYFAYRTIADKEKAAVTEALIAGNKSYSVSREYVDLHFRLLTDESITPSTRALMLREDDSISSRPDLAHKYWELGDACTALYQAVWADHSADIMRMLHQLNTANRPGPHLDQMHDRALKHLLFKYFTLGHASASILSPPPAMDAIAYDVSGTVMGLLDSSFMADRTFGLQTYLKLPSSADASEVLARVKTEWAKHPISTEAFVTTIGSLDSPTTVGLIREMMADTSFFNINLAGHARGLARAWGAIRKRSLLTDDGLALTEELLVKIGKVNQMSAMALISAFSDLKKFPSGPGSQQEKLLQSLVHARDAFDPVAEQSLFNRLTMLLKEYDL